MGGVFLAYRRDDSPAYARAVYDRLAQWLGRKNVFFDINNIEPGLDFVDVLTEQVSSCDALVAIIGRDWVSATDQDNRRRLDDPDDFVRIEIEVALERGIRVIPVLVDGAEMPKPEDLPDSVKKLAYRQGIEISHATFDADIKRLTDGLAFLEDERHRGEAEAAETEGLAPEQREKRHAAEKVANATRARQLPEVEAQRAIEERRAVGVAEAGRSVHEQSEGKAAESLEFTESAVKRRYYVSYARADGSDPSREKDVDRFCAEAQRRGIGVLRDRKDLRPGDLISSFMKRLGEGDKVFIFLSDKYLKSSYCMFELFELWRNSKQSKDEFLRHVHVFSIDGVKIADSADRLEFTKIWKLNRDGLRQVINDVGWEEAGQGAIEDYFRMKTFTSQVSDVLAVFADVVQARTLEDFIDCGFDGPIESAPSLGLSAH